MIGPFVTTRIFCPVRYRATLATCRSVARWAQRTHVCGEVHPIPGINAKPLGKTACFPSQKDSLVKKFYSLARAKCLREFASICGTTLERKGECNQRNQCNQRAIIVCENQPFNCVQGVQRRTLTRLQQPQPG